MMDYAIDGLARLQIGVFGGGDLSAQPVTQADEEKQLKKLADMGFSNREQCLQALRKRRNRVTPSLVEEVCPS